MDMEVDKAYRKALQTVTGWIHREVNTTKTQVFFRTYAPVHFRFALTALCNGYYLRIYEFGDIWNCILVQEHHRTLFVSHHKNRIPSRDFSKCSRSIYDSTRHNFWKHPKCVDFFCWKSFLPYVGVICIRNFFRGGDWRSGGSCHLETLPELGSSLVPSQTWTKYTIFSEILASRANSSNLRALDVLNITHMTSRRKDGHSSLYYLGSNVGPAPIHRQDCSHWCLPGVPDAWNELLYAMFLKRETSKASNSSSFHAQVWWSEFCVHSIYVGE